MYKLKKFQPLYQKNEIYCILSNTIGYIFYKIPYLNSFNINQENESKRKSKRRLIKNWCKSITAKKLLLRKSYYCEKAITANYVYCELHILRIIYTANYIYCEKLRKKFTAKYIYCKTHLLRSFYCEKKPVKFRISLLLYYIIILYCVSNHSFIIHYFYFY